MRKWLILKSDQALLKSVIIRSIFGILKKLLISHVSGMIRPWNFPKYAFLIKRVDRWRFLQFLMTSSKIVFPSVSYTPVTWPSQGSYQSSSLREGCPWYKRLVRTLSRSWGTREVYTPLRPPFTLIVVEKWCTLEAKGLI